MSRTTYTYLKSIDKYLSSDGGFYTEEELDNSLILQREWENTQSLPSFKELLVIFPQAVKVARKHLKRDIKNYKEMLQQITERQQIVQEDIINKAHFSKQPALKKVYDDIFSKRHTYIDKQIRSAIFKLSLTNTLDGKKQIKQKGIDHDAIERAKQVQIKDIFDTKLSVKGKRAVGTCPFHNEKTGSFTIYLNQNSFYCYSCHAGGDVIDYIMKLHNKDFLSAVNYLIQ